MPELHVLRVFTSEGGDGGNPLGVFLDGGSVPARLRQAVAAAIGFSETVFVDDAASGTLQIFTPAIELPFAGHPLVGTAWLLARERRAPAFLRPPAGEVPIRLDAGRAYVSGRPEWAPDFEWFELSSPGAVEALDGPPEGHDMGAAYAWINEADGLVRARVFPRGIGVEEDEATGGAAVRLGGLLRRELLILQGSGSVIEVRPFDGGSVEIGGHVALDDTRDFAV